MWTLACNVNRHFCKTYIDHLVLTCEIGNVQGKNGTNAQIGKKNVCFKINDFERKKIISFKPIIKKKNNQFKS